MSTTTIRIPDDLKARVSAAAKRAGMTAHGFILDAIAEKTGEAEARCDFIDTAERRFAKVVSTGKTIAWSEMRAHLERRLAGRKSLPPVARKPGNL